jgi:hypothetical protein
MCLGRQHWIGSSKQQHQHVSACFVKGWLGATSELIDYQ